MNAWLFQHRSAFRQALRRLGAAPLSTLLGALVVGIALALPAGGEMMLSNLATLTGRLVAKPQLSVFAAPDAGKKELAEIEAQLRRSEGVEALQFVSRDEALKRLKQSEGLADVLDSLPGNPLPDAFIITLHRTDPDKLEQLRAYVAKLPKVEHVQFDSAWVRRLDALLRFGRVALLVLAGLLGVALVAVTFNTIRLQILTDREEIEVSRLLGATDAFIRRPFYHFGVLQGLLGGLVAWLIVYAVAALLASPVAELARAYGIDANLRPLSPGESALLVGFAAVLGWAGAYLSVGQHLRESATR